MRILGVYINVVIPCAVANFTRLCIHTYVEKDGVTVTLWTYFREVPASNFIFWKCSVRISYLRGAGF
jgi:hypothetical protein